MPPLAAAGGLGGPLLQSLQGVGWGDPLVWLAFDCDVGSHWFVSSLYLLGSTEASRMLSKLRAMVISQGCEAVCAQGLEGIMRECCGGAAQLLCCGGTGGSRFIPRPWTTE